MMKVFTRTVSAFAWVALSWGAFADEDAAQDMAPPCTLEDQYEKLHTFDFPQKKPLVFSIADPGGSKDAPVWTDTIKKKYGGRIAFWSIANLSFMPSAARSAARLGIRATSKDPVLCDWDGSVSEGLKSRKGHANIIVIAPTGEILHRTFGKVSDEKLNEVYEAIDSALTASEEQDGGDL